MEEIVKKWSETNPLLETIAMEECGELIQAISKIIRYGSTDGEIKSLSEECADVLICIEALAEKYGLRPYIEAWQKSKVKRLDERMKLASYQQVKNNHFAEDSKKVVLQQQVTGKLDGKSAGYHKCVNCKWYDNFIGVCLCGNMGWRDDDDVCERWEDKYGNP